MMMITVTRVLYFQSYYLNLTCPTCGTCESSPFWGALPLLIYVEGEGYMWIPIKIRTSLPSNTSWIQVQVLTPCKINVPHAFPRKLAHHNMNRPSGPRALSSICPAVGVITKSPNTHRVSVSRHTSGRVIPRGISPTGPQNGE